MATVLVPLDSASAWVCVCVCYLTYVPRYIFRERSSQGECTLKKLNYGTLAKTSFSLLCHFDVEKCFFVQGRLPTYRPT